MKYLTLVAVFYVHTLLVAGVTDKIFCYYGSWAYYRNIGKVATTDLNTTLCTHIIYTFIGITKNAEVKLLDAWLDVTMGGIKNTVALKERNANLKVLFAIGGWNEGAGAFSLIAADADLRKSFGRNAVNFIKEHNLDGMDVDWRYPGDNKGRPEDKQNFVLLLEELRNVFDEHGYILSAALSGTREQREISYDVTNINRHLHFMNIMIYDLHGSWEGKTGPHAPFTATSDDISHLNVISIIDEWIQAGASASKLLLGIPFYGRSFTLKDVNNHGMDAPTTGAGNAGVATRESGSLSYAEICSNIKNSGWKEEYDKSRHAYYSYHGNQWVGYDNIHSVREKVSYAITKGLAGVMVRTIDQDDVKNECGGGTWTLLTAIKKRLQLVQPQMYG